MIRKPGKGRAVCTCACSSCSPYKINFITCLLNPLCFSGNTQTSSELPNSFNSVCLRGECRLRSSRFRFLLAKREKHSPHALARLPLGWKEAKTTAMQAMASVVLLLASFHSRVNFLSILSILMNIAVLDWKILFSYLIVLIHGRRNRPMFTGCFSVSYHPFNVPLQEGLYLNSRLSSTWMPLSTRFTGSDTTFIPRRTSMIFLVHIR